MDSKGNMHNQRLTNMGDPKFDKDATNLRTLRRLMLDSTATFTGGTVIGPTLFDDSSGLWVSISGGTIIVGGSGATTITGAHVSATTYYGDGSNLTGVGSGTFTGGTITGPTTFNDWVVMLNGLTATTLSATTYYGDGSNLGGISTDNFYTSAATLNGNVLYFDRTDSLSAYSVDLSSITTTGATGGSGGTIFSSTEPSPATFSANTWTRTTDYNLFVYNDSLSKWIGVNSDRIGGARNRSNQNNIFLRYEDGTPYNVSPFKTHGDYIITNIVASSGGLDSWNAHILTGTTITTDSIYNLRLNSESFKADNNANVEVSSGTSLYLYMSGTSVSYPKMEVYIRNR